MGRDPQTIAETLRARRDSPRGVAILDEDLNATPLTFAELHEDARTWAGALAARGVAPGDRVALLGSTTREYVACVFGTWLSSAVAVPLAIPTRIPDPVHFVEGLRARIEHAQARLVVADGALGAFGDLSSLAENVATFEGLAAEPRRLVERDPSPADAALIQYTSGSTGAPKGVVLTHEAILANARAAQDRGRMTPDDVVVSWLPLFHDFGLIGMTLWPVIMDMATYLMAPERFISSPRRWLEAMHRYGASITAAPNFAYALAARALRSSERTLDLHRVRLAANGAEPIDADTMDDFATSGAPHGLRPDARFPVYGLAEATLGVCTPEPLEPLVTQHAGADALAAGRLEPAEDECRRLVGVGRPIRGVEVEVRDDRGLPLQSRGVGTIWVRTEHGMDGYWRDPAATEAVVTDGWIDTGDLGSIVDDHLFVTGRRKDVIVVAGRNVYPDDAERAAQVVEGVRRGNAVAFSGRGRRGESVVVVAETRAALAEARGAARAVSAAVRRALGIRPERVLLIQPGALPKTPSGKLQRSRTRDMYLSGELDGVAVADSRGR